MQTRKLASGFIAVGALTLVLSACDSGGDPQELEQPKTTNAELVIPGCGEVNLDTLISDSIQIDQVGSGPGNANLFFSASDPDKPAGANIDWNNLANVLADHRVLDDCNPTLAKDLSSFPQSNSCVGSSSVLDKQNLTYAAVANNSSNVFLGVQRASNNGDSAYYWLFTLDQPEFANSPDNSCKSGKNLVYDISATNGGSGDVLIVGNFSPSGGPQLTVYQANGNFENVLAENVLDTNFAVNGTKVWKTATATVFAAVNTSNADPGAFGSAGVISLDKTTGFLQPGIFAEAAVPLSVFTGGSSCGATYFASVLTQPSSSSTSDMKDFIGPFEVNFGSVTAAGSLSPSCDGTVGYTLTSALGPNGQQLPTFNCEWTFKSGTTTLGTVTLSNKTTLAGCSGTFTLPANTAPATVTATVKVTDASAGSGACTSTASAGSADVLVPITVSIAPDNASLQCSGIDSSGDDVTYTATVSGGKSPYSFSWTGCSSTTSTCTLNPSDSDFCVDTDVFVNVDDSSTLCPVKKSNTQVYHKETTVTSTAKP